MLPHSPSDHRSWAQRNPWHSRFRFLGKKTWRFGKLRGIPCPSTLLIEKSSRTDHTFWGRINGKTWSFPPPDQKFPFRGDHILQSRQLQSRLFPTFPQFLPSQWGIFLSTQHHVSQLKRMLVQHNIRIVSKYYGQLSLDRLSQLLEVEKDYCEEELCTLNNNKTI